MPSSAWDADAIHALTEQRIDARDKALPPRWHGRTVAEIVAARVTLSELPTPLLTLSAAGITHNLAAMARWCTKRGVELAPHGKTTMAPALWAAQLDAGACAITLANASQAAVARAFGFNRLLIANTVISPQALTWLADELVADPTFEVSVWADSLAAVEQLVSALRPGHTPDRRPLDVQVELGGIGGRTGARDARTALEIARAVAAAPELRLTGVAGYEGALAHDASPASLERVREYLRKLGLLHSRLRTEGLYPSELSPVVTAGGSAYFELVADELAPLAADGARVVLRSGAYIVHDDGFYEDISPLGEHRRTGGDRLRPAMHGWVRVTSQPEPGLAIFDAGKRDLPYDMDLPRPQMRRSRAPGDPAYRLDELTVTAFNDQHGFLSFDTNEAPPVRVGDVLRLGLSHPCTAFDKWSLIPVVDNPDADDPVVVDLVRTYF